MKLSEYIQKETSADIKRNEEDKRNRITENIAKEDYRENFNHLVFNVIGNKIYQLSNQISEFSTKEDKRKMSEFPYVVSHIIEIDINHNIAQYFLEITGNFNEYSDGVIFKFESAGYGRALEIEKIPFSELENMDIEEYLIKSMEEFKK